MAAGGIFDEIQFPTNIAIDSIFGPEYSTRLESFDNKHEFRHQMWRQQGIARYAIAHGLKEAKEMMAIISFFRARRGKFRGFRLKDWSDYTAAAQNIRINPDGVPQLAILYPDAVNSTIRFISKPVAGTVTYTGGGTLDYTTGLVPGNTAGQWSGEFDVPVRFDTDELIYRMIHADVFELDAVPMAEINI